MIDSPHLEDQVAAAPAGGAPAPALERCFHQVQVERPGPEETAAGARTRLAGKFPRGAVRRMTHLGLLLGSALDGLPCEKMDALVYASTFAETRALEDFLASFPLASPLLFQASIHPGAVQQVLIGRQQPVARLWPLAGRTRLVEQALLTALLDPAAVVVLAGGEERGTWLLEHDMAAATSFAFAAVLTCDPAGAIGRVSFTPGPAADDTCPMLEEFAIALSVRGALRWSGAGGDWSLVWP
ncbi:MAG TPA: hypothetical protein VL200_12840 [Lacunisphaera sp.]|jgi:hypothetical protein|nr:hypothetical protein [Lacunisphaera sp.]